MTGDMTPVRRLVIIAMLSGCGLVLFVFESFLPVMPWFRPGLGNIATLIALLMLGFKDALKVTLLRIVLGSLIIGRLFTPVFVFAFAGGIASVMVMAAAEKAMGRFIGPVGISTLGALAHNLVQLYVAYLLFVKSAEVFIFTPVFMMAGVITGALTGFITALAMVRLGGRFGLHKEWRWLPSRGK